ncbi:MAG: hypothetical protein QXD89_02685 [Candidatus Aenigmatarchaeota archaeon]
MNEKEIREKIEKGWIRSKVWFDVLAITEKAAEESLEQHVEKLKKLDGCLIISEKYEKTIEQEKPLPRIEKAFSKAVELEILTKNLEILLQVVIFFAPSAVEIIEPLEYKVKANSIQTMMNTVADLIHRFAAQGIGGIVITKT